MKSPIKHVRDGFCNWGTMSTFCRGTWVRRWNEIAAAGIRTDVVTDAWMGWNSNCNGTCFEQYSNALGINPSSIEAFEDPNECDQHSNCTEFGARKVTAAYTVANWTPLLWTLHSPSIAIFGPAMAFPQGYAQFGNLSPYMDYGSIHDYPGNDYPENDVVPIWRSGAAEMSGELPLVSTETGYNTDPTFSNHGVSELAQERYIPRMLFTHLYYGIRRSYLYEFFDFPAGSGTGQYFGGLLHGDYTPKPAWSRLMGLMDYFTDSDISPRQPLRYEIPAAQCGVLYHVLFQRSNGVYLLALWLATPLWNRIGHTDMAPTTERITLRLPKSATAVHMTEFNDNGQVTHIHKRAVNGTVTVDVSSLISVVAFHL